jgi:histidinol-phosphate phosphatase family protein
MHFDVVVPTVGRLALERLLTALAVGDGPWPARVVVVDDRPGRPGGPVPVAGALRAGLPVCVVRGRGAGPAAARNLGWRAGRAAWVAFLDDDVVPPPGWRAELARDLDGLPPDVAGSQGRVRVPRPATRRATDWERNVAGLEGAVWATADLCYRRDALEAAAGFDERFARAYREDSDLGLRLVAGGWTIVGGGREVEHPVAPASASVSLRLQAGNADDALMRRLHGRAWRAAAGAARGRRPRHLATTAAAAATLLPRLGPRARALACAAWLAGTAELAWARIAPGPRTAREIGRMAWTSALMPPTATAHAVRGAVRWRRVAPARRAPAPPPAAVLLDRDGTLVRDVPYNDDPDRVFPMPGAREALDRLRARGVRLGVVSNQSGVGRGLVAPEALAAVNARVEELLGPLGPWAVCPHAPEDGCVCRKPRPGLVLEAAARLDLPAHRCAVIGDIGADVDAARAAGARAVLVPTPRTRPEETLRAPAVAPDLPAAVALLLGEQPVASSVGEELAA